MANMTENRPIVVGGGNLGGAVARGLARGGLKPLVVELPGPAFDGLIADGIEALTELSEAVARSHGPVFIALKPWLMADYCRMNAELLADKVCVSCAALVSLNILKAAAPKARWGRMMTNIAAAVGSAFTGVVKGDWTEEQAEAVKALCLNLGDAAFCAEGDLDAIIGLSGSGIAYVLELLEGFIQGGLAVGMKSDMSLRLGIATLESAASLAKARGVHPAVLKDSVCTPGGTTIAGIRSLQRSGFRSAFIEALVETAEASKAGTKAFNDAAR